MNTRIKKGITLIETIIAIAIFAIGMQGFALLFAKSLEINSFTLRSGENARAASRGVQNVIDIIRNARQADNGAFVIVSASDNDLVIYGNADNDSATERIHYFLENGILKEGVTHPNTEVPPVYPTGDQQISSVANYVVNDVEQVVFKYYDIDNNILSTPAVINSVKMIRVYLEINIDPAKDAENTVIQSYATIRNLGEYD